MAAYNDETDSLYSTTQDEGGEEPLASDSGQSSHHESDVNLFESGLGQTHEKVYVPPQGGAMGTGYQASLAPSSSVQPDDSYSQYNPSGYYPYSTNPSADSQAGYTPWSGQFEQGQYTLYCVYYDNCRAQSRNWEEKDWVAHLRQHLMDLRKSKLRCMYQYCQKSYAASSDEDKRKKAKKLAYHLYKHMVDYAIQQGCTSETPSEVPSVTFHQTEGNSNGPTRQVDVTHPQTIDEDLS